jgi:DNA-binding CsgD family transcriptional regulator
MIAWINPATRRLAGNITGHRYTSWVAPESRSVVEREFSRKMLGAADTSDYEVILQAGDGRRFAAEISSARLEEDGHVAGVFGVVRPLREPVPPPAAAVKLTTRQAQVLHLLAQGGSTAHIADELGLSQETVRNHIRGLLRRLGVHSRLEAVVVGHERGLV